MALSTATKLRAPERGVMATSALLRWRRASALRLARREVVAATNGAAIYLVVTLACLAAGITVRGYLDYIVANGTLVLAAPLRAPLLFAIMVMTAYLGLSAAASVAGEKERGTLEVLFFGPVDAWGYIAGKALGLLGIYALLLLGVSIYLLLVAAITAIPVDGATVGLLVLSTTPAMCMIAFGMLIAAYTTRVRLAVALMLVTTVVFYAIELGNQFLAAQAGDSMLGSSAQLLSAVAAVAAWLSPFSYLFRGVESIALGDPSAVAINALAPLVYAALLLWLTVVVLRRNGVQRWRE